MTVSTNRSRVVLDPNQQAQAKDAGQPQAVAQKPRSGLAVDPFGVDVQARQLGWIEPRQLEPAEGQGREEQELALGQHVGGGIGGIVHRKGQQALQQQG